MIDQTERDALRSRVKGDIDYKAAALLYKKQTGRSIHWRYLYKFLVGERKVEGLKAGSHQPLKMFGAVVDAIKKREAEADEMTVAARELRQRLAA